MRRELPLKTALKPEQQAKALAACDAAEKWLSEKELEWQKVPLCEKSPITAEMVEAENGKVRICWKALSSHGTAHKDPAIDAPQGSYYPLYALYALVALLALPAMYMAFIAIPGAPVCGGGMPASS